MTTSVIEASSGTYRSRVDGTLVLQVEVQPMHARDAIALFGAFGTPMALAALKPATSKPEKPERERLGPLCFLAVQWCKEPDFRLWLLGPGAGTEKEAAEGIYDRCGITSRKELDTSENAAAKFDSLVRRPYAAWLKKQGETA